MRERFQRKNYIIDVAKLRRAQKQLGTASETETIHKALELAANEVDLAKALRELLKKGKGRVVDAAS
jgi:predicted kinase